MKRWVNSHNIAEKIQYGYRPSIPLEIKDVGADTQALLMEVLDADYAENQRRKQIKNDKRTPSGGVDLLEYRKDIKTEVMCFLSYAITKRQIFGLMLRKFFGCKTSDYVKGILSWDDVSWDHEKNIMDSISQEVSDD